MVNVLASSITLLPEIGMAGSRKHTSKLTFHSAVVLHLICTHAQQLKKKNLDRRRKGVKGSSAQAALLAFKGGTLSFQHLKTLAAAQVLVSTC